MKRTKVIPIRLVQEKHDIDWDGVPNYRDCEPLNPLMQDNLPEMLKKFKNKIIKSKKSIKNLVRSYGEFLLMVSPGITSFYLARNVVPEPESVYLEGFGWVYMVGLFTFSSYTLAKHYRKQILEYIKKSKKYS